ncbi:MAG TPA: copper chaperone PCu(A)C [Allosphingosinicella sp.]|nr:copper chaperone PCu(A)C [Allosphingosinicella sp.]
MSFLAVLMMLSSIRAVAVIDPVVAAAPAGADAALYLVIRNSSGTEDRLVGVSCDCAERIEIHNMVGEGAGGRMDVEPSLAMPPSRLVEVAPGGSRHLMLIGLRRPLVAGQTVSLTFRFASGGHDTRAVPVVEDTRAAWASALAQPRPQRLAAMAFFAGSCWRGTFPDSRRTDTHCFSPIYEGNFLQDRHVVEGAPAPYSGTSLYHYDVMGRSITYQYRASDGSASGGVARPTPDGLSFPAETHRSADGRETVIRSAWIRDGADAYLVRAEARAGAGWRELWRMRMVRTGPTPP